MPYRAPVSDIAFALKHAAGLKAALAEGLYGDLDEAMVYQVLVEAGRFATDVIAPLNRVGDKSGTPFKDGAVTTPPCSSPSRKRAPMSAPCARARRAHPTEAIASPARKSSSPMASTT